jgi:hypothetical protein
MWIEPRRRRPSITVLNAILRTRAYQGTTRDRPPSAHQALVCKSDEERILTRTLRMKMKMNIENN